MFVTDQLMVSCSFEADGCARISFAISLDIYDMGV